MTGTAWLEEKKKNIYIYIYIYHARDKSKINLESMVRPD